MTQANEAKSPGKPAETIQVLMLKGYVPKAPEVLSTEDDKPQTLLKHKKGETVELPAAEAKALMKIGGAVRPDEATEAHLIQAGLMAPPEPEDDE